LEDRCLVVVQRPHHAPDIGGRLLQQRARRRGVEKGSDGGWLLWLLLGWWWRRWLRGPIEVAPAVLLIVILILLGCLAALGFRSSRSRGRWRGWR
jgi:hypothetical protein